ncbi:MAG TPA: tetratricopeptide repeat protein [Chlorobiota bacterium]|nr:tetratricopeptide repeat protein [Chlorobiota bacterium]
MPHPTAHERPFRPLPQQGSQKPMPFGCTVVAIVLLTLGITTPGAAQYIVPDAAMKDSIKKEVTKAMDYMEFGQGEDAMRVWRRIIDMDPGNPAFRYEFGVSAVLARRYDTARTVVEPIYRDSIFRDQGYQLMGMIYLYLQDTLKARETFEAGLAKYPKSGRLHYELGSYHTVAGRLEQGMDFWIQGTRVEPTFPTNYFWVAKMHANGPNKIWTLIFGEVFLNLERNTEKTKEMSELVFRTWNAGMRLGDTIDPINFAHDSLLEKPGPTGASTMPFEMAFEYTAATSAQPFIPDNGVLPRLTMQQLVDLRYRMIAQWRRSGYDTLYTNSLIDWNIELQKSGWFKEYLRWLYSWGDKKEMNDWFLKNERRYDTFLAWFTTNGMKFDKPLCLGLGCP